MRIYSLVFLLGNLAVHQLAILDKNNLWLLAGFSITLILSGFILGYFKASYQYKKQAYQFLIFILVFNLAFNLTWFRVSQVLEHKLPAQLENKELIIQAQIDSIPSYYPNSLGSSWGKGGDGFVKFNAKVLQLQGQESFDFNAKVRLTWYQVKKSFAQSLQVGDIWQFKVKLKSPSGLMNTGGFDYEKKLFEQGIRATGYIRVFKENKRLSEAKGFNYQLDRWRQQFANNLREQLGDNQFKGVFLALVLGIKSDINAAQWQVFSGSSTNHLMAISGLHIGLIAGMGFFLGRRLFSLSETLLKKIPAQHVAAFLALVFAFIYAALAGFSIPTQRALIMVMVVLGAILFRLKISPLTILSYALIIILCLDPLSSLSIGFWLSFAAVFAILSFLTWQKANQDGYKVEGEERHLGLKYLNKAYLALKGLTLIQLVLFIALLPLTILFFGRISLLAPLANLIMVPWMSLIIIPLSLFSALVSLISPSIANSLFSFNEQLMLPAWNVVEYLTAFEFNLLYLNLEQLWFLIAIFVVATVLLLKRESRYKWWSLVLFLPLILPLLLPRSFLPNSWQIRQKPDDGQFKLSALDVGQGLSLVIQTANHTLLYDTGRYFSPRFDMANMVILPFLHQANIEQLDLLVLSHADDDHASAATSLLQQISAQGVIAGEPRRIENKYQLDLLLSSPVQACKSGESWLWDGVKFTIISSKFSDDNQVLTKTTNNNASCVILIEAKSGFSALLLGDIEKTIERKIISSSYLKKIAVDENALNDIDVLVAAHHGSKSSSDELFIQKTTPKHVIFSAAYNNHFHFPAIEVVKRFNKYGSKLLSTQNGMIEILSTMKNQQPLIFIYRRDKQRYWHRPYKDVISPN